MNENENEEEYVFQREEITEKRFLQLLLKWNFHFLMYILENNKYFSNHKINTSNTIIIFLLTI